MTFYDSMSQAHKKRNLRSRHEQSERTVKEKYADVFAGSLKPRPDASQRSPLVGESAYKNETRHLPFVSRISACRSD